MMTLANTEETSFYSYISFYVIPEWTCTVPTARPSSARDILEPRSGTLLQMMNPARIMQHQVDAFGGDDRIYMRTYLTPCHTGIQNP